MSRLINKLEYLLRQFRQLGRNVYQHNEIDGEVDQYLVGKYDAYEHAGNLLNELLNREVEP